jgi:hypothetical protein
LFGLTADTGQGTIGLYNRIMKGYIMKKNQKGRPYPIRLTDAEREALKRIADENGRTIVGQIRVWIRQESNKNAQENRP